MVTAHDKTTVRRLLDEAKAAARGALTAPEAKRLCEAYGIRVPQEAVAGSAAEAAQIASRIGYPVVMKIVSPQILHKTEAGGVVVGVKSAEAARQAFDTILANARRYKADATLEGVQVQQMLTRRPGSDHRRGDRSGLRQAGGVRPRRDPGGGVEGHHLPPRAGDA